MTRIKKALSIFEKESDIPKILGKELIIDPMFGFEKIKKWKLEKESNGLLRLKGQPTGNPNFAVAPLDFFKSVRGDKVKLAILTIPQNKENTQVNLISPIEIDPDSLQGKQIRVKRKEGKLRLQPAFDVLKKNKVRI